MEFCKCEKCHRVLSLLIMAENHEIFDAKKVAEEFEELDRNTTEGIAFFKCPKCLQNVESGKRHIHDAYGHWTVPLF